MLSTKVSQKELSTERWAAMTPPACITQSRNVLESQVQREGRVRTTSPDTQSVWTATLPKGYSCRH